MTGQILLCTGNARKIIRDLTNNEFVSFIVLLFSIRLVCLELVLFDLLPLRCYLLYVYTQFVNFKNERDKCFKKRISSNRVALGSITTGSPNSRYFGKGVR